MANVVISDLSRCEGLDSQARVAARGGFIFGWITPYELTRRSSEAGIVPSFVQVNQFLGDVVVNQDITQVFQTTNQFQIIDVNVDSIFDSIVEINLGQGQFGTNS